MTENRTVRSIFAAFDSALFSVLLFIPFYLIYAKGKSPVLSIAVFAGVLGIVLLLRKRSEIMRKREAAENLKRQERLEAILLKSDGELAELLGQKRFYLIRKKHPDMFDVLEAVRKGSDSIGMIEADRKVTELIQKYRPDTAVLSVEEIAARLFPDSRTEPDRRTLKTLLHSVSKYVLLGSILLVASLFLHYKIYLRLTASVCFLLYALKNLYAKKKERHSPLPID